MWLLNLVALFIGVENAGSSNLRRFRKTSLGRSAPCLSISSAQVFPQKGIVTWLAYCYYAVVKACLGYWNVFRFVRVNCFKLVCNNPVNKSQAKIDY